MGSSGDENLQLDVREDKATGLITVIKGDSFDETGLDALKEDSIGQHSHESGIPLTRLSQNTSTKKKRRGRKVKITDEEEEYFDPSAYKFKKPDYNYQQEMYK